jgi:hypothetical protein
MENTLPSLCEDRLWLSFLPTTLHAPNLINPNICLFYWCHHSNVIPIVPTEYLLTGEHM